MLLRRYLKRQSRACLQKFEFFHLNLILSHALAYSIFFHAQMNSMINALHIQRPSQRSLSTASFARPSVRRCPFWPTSPSSGRRLCSTATSWQRRCAALRARGDGEFQLNICVWISVLFVRAHFCNTACSFLGSVCILILILIWILILTLISTLKSEFDL